MARKVQLQTNGKEWRNGQYVDVEKRDIDPITSSSCVQIEGFRTLEEAVSDNKMLSQDLTYTKVMDKVGGDYHQNVLDGQYNKAILYGNTQVNLCEEDTSVGLQIPTTFTSFNNGELQIKNKENQVVAPLIKGVTMVNLAQTNSASITSGNGLPIHNVKGNTLYTLLFKFTTKNTNSGIVIQSYDANGTYLENTMHKTGLGDVVKFTFTTHANATKVHICNNAAYGGETIQLDEIMLIEGDQTALDIPFFKGMKSVELVRPLTNLFTNDLQHYDANVTSTNNNGTVTVTASSNNSWANVHYNLANLKANTNYLVMWDSVATNQTSTTSTDILICVAQASNNSNLGRMDNNDLNPTKRCMMFNTGNVPLTDIVLRVHATLGNTETATTTVTGLRVFEYDDYLRSVDLQSIGWFSGTKNVAVEPIKTCSKNLYPYGDINFTPTQVQWHDAKGTNYMYGDIAQKSKCRFLLKKGTYKLSSDYNNRTNLGYMALVTDKEETMKDTTFTLEEDTYLTLRLQPVEANVPTTLTNIQIERGETVTDYVAHDSRYYEPNGQNAILLRSLPSGVCDTFNLQTGEYTRRIGEVIFNGSEEWTQNGNGSYGFFTTKQDSKPSSTIVCDKLKEITGWNNCSEKGIFRGTQAFGVVLTSNELTTCNVETFKTWLSQNPLTVQYELATPITTIIPRTIKRNNNGTISTIDFRTYTNKESLVLPSNPSYLTINSMTSIKPVVEPITYIDFKTRLKANTDYSVIMDKDSNTSKTINFGGTSKTYTDKMLVRTPSINLEQNLRISGGGSIQNIMVIESNVLDKELPYFNGMCDVKMPIVRNCGRNLCNSNEIVVADAWKSDTQIGDNRVISVCKIEKGGGFGAKVRIKVKPNTTYYLGWEGENNTYVYVYYNSDVWGNNGSKLVNRNTTFTTLPNVDYITIGLNYISNGMSVGYTTIIYNLILVEANDNTNYIPYRGNDICIAQGEIELSKDMFEQGGFSTGNGKYTTYETMKYDNTARLRSKDLIPVKPNTTYAFAHSFSKFAYNVYQWNGNKGFIDETSQYFASGQVETITTTADTQYIHFLMSKHDASQTITLAEYDWSQFHMYELDSTVQLRSLPNGVKDELNLLTGEYIQRVGEVVLDGSEEWKGWESNETHFKCSLSNYPLNMRIDGQHTTRLTCDKLNVKEDIVGVVNDDFIASVGDRLYTIIIGMSFDNLITKDGDGFKQWLRENKPVVQYELAEPIISYPRIVSNTQEREVGVKLPNGVCDTYNPSTGITVKRVGKIMLDGSEKISNHNHSNWMNDSVYGIMIQPPKDMALMTQSSYGSDIYNMFSDSLPMVWSKGSFGANKEGIGLYNEDMILYASIGRSKLATQDLDGVKAYLASNPITLYYELKHPIVTTDIVLPNGVHDEYNPLTGLYTKRVGFVEFDGSETWGADPGWTSTENLIRFSAQISDMKLQYNNGHLLCDKLPVVQSGTVPCIYNRWDNYIFLDFSASDINVSFGTDSNEVMVTKLKTYLSQNPIKVWYELQTPITYQLTPYFGLPMPYAYKDGYLIMDSAYDGQTLPPEITYQLIVNRTGQITQNNIKLKEHTARLSNLEYMLIEATLDSIFDREMQNFELELMNVELLDLNE